MTELNEHELIKEMLHGIRDAELTARDLAKTTKNNAYQSVAAQLAVLAGLARKLCTDKPVSRNQLLSAVERQVEFNKKQNAPAPLVLQ